MSFSLKIVYWGCYEFSTSPTNTYGIYVTRKLSVVPVPLYFYIKNTSIVPCDIVEKSFLISRKKKPTNEKTSIFLRHSQN